MWDPSGPDIKPVSLALTGIFLTTEPPRKPSPSFLTFFERYFCNRILGWQVFVFLSVKMLFHCLLASFLPNFPNLTVRNLCSLSFSLSNLFFSLVGFKLFLFITGFKQFDYDVIYSFHVYFFYSTPFIYSFHESLIPFMFPVLRDHLGFFIHGFISSLTLESLWPLFLQIFFLVSPLYSFRDSEYMFIRVISQLIDAALIFLLSLSFFVYVFYFG